MKVIKNILMLCSILLFASTTISAQGKGPGGNMKQRFANAQFNEVKRALQLDEATTAKFELIYKEYLTELGKLAQGEKERLGKGRIDSLTNDQAEKIIKKRFQRAEQMVNIREKYYDAFKKVLTPKQILIVYQTENRVVRKTEKEFRHRMEKRMERKKMYK